MDEISFKSNQTACFISIFSTQDMIPLLLVLVLTLLTATASRCNFPVETWYQKNKYKFDGSTLKTFSYICQSVCYEACWSFAACYSVNYYPGNKTCELNNSTHFEFPENLTSGEGSEYAYTFARGK